MIGHEIAASLPELRAEAESLMVVPCVIERIDHDTPTYDPENGYRTDTWVEVWAGGCKFRTSQNARTVDLGGQEVTVKPINVGIPWDAPQPRVGDRLTTDHGVFFVTDVDHHSQGIMRRFSCAEHQG